MNRLCTEIAVVASMEAIAKAKRRRVNKNSHRKGEEDEIASLLALVEKPNAKTLQTWAKAELFKRSNTTTSKLDSSQVNMLLSVVSMVKNIKDFAPSDMSKYLIRAGLCVLDYDYENYGVVMKDLHTLEQKSALSTRMLTDGKIGNPDILSKTNDNNIVNRRVDTRPQF